MKDVTTAVTTQGNVGNTGTAMTIHSGAIGKLMSMFSNQYSNAAVAVVREYFCNGDDARIMAGSDRPTEVFLPTELQPTLVVRDYGIGLDKDGLVTTFATYGLSTKDDTNDQTGGFGIGSKAAFTLGQQFTVTGYKDGRVTTALFALDSHGVGQVTIMHEGTTQEPNGVRVEVGVPDIEAMKRSARSFFLTVPKGRALVDGKEPEHLFDTVDFVRLTEEAVLVKDGEGEIRVQMGPVVYPVTRDILRSVSKRLDGLDSQTIANALADWNTHDSVLMEVGMGDVSIAPSREDLRDTEATVSRLSAVVQGISDYIHGGIQAQIDAAGSRYAAAMILHRSVEALKGFRVKKSAFTYNGAEKAFKSEVTAPFPVFHLVKKSWRSATMIVGREDKFTVDFDRASRTVVVAGVPTTDVSKVSRYAKRYLESQEDVSYLMVTDQASGSEEWFEWGTATGATTITLDDYRAHLRTLRVSNPRTRTEPSYTVGWSTDAERDPDDRDLLSEILDEGKDLVIFYENSRVNNAFAQKVLDKKFTPVVLLAQQSENALRKRVEEDGRVKIFEGNWQDIVRKAAERKIQKAVLTPDERFALGAQAWIENVKDGWRGTKTWVHNLMDLLGDRAAEVTHPHLLEVLEVHEIAVEVSKDITAERQREIAALAHWVTVEGGSALPFEFDVKSMSSVLPLLSEANISSYDISRRPHLVDDMIAYINSKA